MKYTLQSSALALLICLGSTLAAFVPSSVISPNPNAWGVKHSNAVASSKLSMAKEESELKLDTNFDDINVVRLMGLQRMKKMIRKNKSLADAAQKVSSSASASTSTQAQAQAPADAAPVAAKKAGLKIIIAGAPASGKGTQCEIIKKEYGVVHLSTGDMLRAAVAAGTDVGKQAKAFMDAGKLVPDEVIIGVVSKDMIMIMLMIMLMLMLMGV